MNNIENLLYEEKTRMSGLTAPENMETRLRKALSTAAPKRAFRNRMSGWRIAVAVLAVMLVAGNQYHALAYYGKMLFGFDRVVNGTLDELIQKGWGQSLNEQVKLVDGSVLTVNGIMSDENQFILYYTLSNPNGLADEDMNRFLPARIKGFRTDSRMQTGNSELSKDRTETKGVLTYEPVSPLAKKLTLSYWEDLPNGGQRQEGHLTFPYHPDEAMPTKIKQSIHQTLIVDDSSAIFGSITATPTMTLIEGTIQKENHELFSQVLGGVELVANGRQVFRIRGDINIKPSKNGYIFTLRYDPLPENLKSVQLVLKENGETLEIPVK